MAKPKRELNYEDFELIEMSYNEKAQKLHIKYREKDSTGETWKCDSPETPHPDLVNSLEAFRPHAARILGLQKGWDVAREELRGDLDRLKQAVNGSKEADESITNIATIKLMGDGDTRGIKIIGSLRSLAGIMKVQLPVIRFEREVLAIEKTLEGLYWDANEAAYGFIYQGKRKAPELFNEDEAPKGRGKGKGRQTDLVEESEKASQD